MRLNVRAVAGLGVLVGVAVAIAGAQVASQEKQLPVGSSYSYQPDGAQALYLWTEALGARPQRVERLDRLPANAADLVLVVQPETGPTAAGTRALEAALGRGGTVVLAGDSFPMWAYLSALNVRMDPTEIVTSATAPESGAALPIRAGSRLRADDATPLLLAPNGDWLALRKPHRNGSVVVIATADPLTNAALHDRDVARWVYREILASLPRGGSVAFDESRHASVTPPVSAPVSFRQLALESAPGRAALYAAALIFLYRLLSGRRLGPPLPAADPGEASRTMFEHVQALAGLYRRARQFGYVRDFFAHHYGRAAARSLGVEAGRLSTPEGLASEVRGRGIPADLADPLVDALAQVANARSESQLIAAVARADAALASLPRSSSRQV
jgi:hypothetical protein